MEIREITLTTPTEWQDFVADNRDEFDGAEKIAFALDAAKNGGFEMGGGATPLTVIYYVDDEVQARIDALNY